MLLWGRKGGQHAVFPWLECLSHTQNLSHRCLSSALALTPECCMTSTGADDVFCDTFLPVSPALSCDHTSPQSHGPYRQQHFCPRFGFVIVRLILFSSSVTFSPSVYKDVQLEPVIHKDKTSSRALQHKLDMCWTINTHHFHLTSFICSNLSRLVARSCILV